MLTRSRFFWLTLGAVVFTSAAVRSGAVSPSHPAAYRLVHGAASQSFILANDAVIRHGTNSSASLSDLKPGEDARVAYTIVNGLWYAHEIDVHAAHGHHSTGTTNMLHTHGAVLGYNVFTGNLTIRFHRSSAKP